jgi:hypothetical protein
MTDRSYIQENQAARQELAQLIAELDERAFARPVGTGWTVATSLCHLAFWDQRALFVLSEWERSGHIDPPRLDPQTVESINAGVTAIAHAVPGPAAARLALNSAAAVDARLAGLSNESIDRLVAIGFDRYLRRYLHRREHLRALRRALDEKSAQ